MAPACGLGRGVDSGAAASRVYAVAVEGSGRVNQFIPTAPCSVTGPRSTGGRDGTEGMFLVGSDPTCRARLGRLMEQVRRKALPMIRASWAYLAPPIGRWLNADVLVVQHNNPLAAPAQKAFRHDWTF